MHIYIIKIYMVALFIIIHIAIADNSLNSNRLLYDYT